MRFMPNHSSFPFDGDSHGEMWDLHLGPELSQQIKEWNDFFLNHFDIETGNFPTQADRAWFDRTYIEIYNKLRARRLNPELSAWW